MMGSSLMHKATCTTVCGTLELVVSAQLWSMLKSVCDFEFFLGLPPVPGTGLQTAQAGTRSRKGL